MDIRTVSQDTVQVLLNLMQAYEAEFSAITAKLPQSDGLFSLDTPIDDDHNGWLLYDRGAPVGFAITGLHSNRHDISDFYVIPALRGHGLGMRFAHKIFGLHPGLWQVRQISGADSAINFWRKTISIFTHGAFLETTEEDEYWGRVTVQRFVSKPHYPILIPSKRGL
jgi:predicted acetyltransferase